ncbi:uncharacterized protein O3C94_002915 [Discoglossus pictus]
MLCVSCALYHTPGIMYRKGRSRGKKMDTGTTQERRNRVVREMISQDSMVMIDDMPVAAAVARPARPTRARKNTSRSERRSRSRSRRSCRCSCACGSERGRSPQRARRSESPGRQERRRDTPLAVSTPRLPEAGGQKQLWIVGHSYVYWAHRLAAVSEGRTQLGFPVTDLHVRWLGVRGLRWAQLDELLNTCSQRYGQPTIIIIHAGGNDLGAVPMRRMLKVMKRDVENWTKKFPGTFLIWSEMIKRRSWRNARDPVGLDKARQKINQQLSSFIRKLGFIAIRIVKGRDSLSLAVISGSSQEHQDQHKPYNLLFSELEKERETNPTSRSHPIHLFPSSRIAASVQDEK